LTSFSIENHTLTSI